MSDLKRIRKVLNWLIFSDYASNDNDLAIKLGYTKSSFSQIINGKVPLSDKFIDRLCALDYNINKVWIKTGKGEIIIKKDYSNVLNEPIEEYGNKKCTNCKNLEHENRKLKDEIIQLKDELLEVYRPKKGDLMAG